MDDMRRTGRLSTLAILGVMVTGAVQSQQLYWVQANYPEPKIRMMTTDGKEVTSSALTPGSLPHGMAIDTKSSRLFWASGAYAGAHLYTSSQTFTRTDTLPNGGTQSSFQGIAIDSGGGKVYWTSTSINRGCVIRRANLDGSSEDSLVGYPAGGPENLRGIALDPAHGMMYWTDFDSGLIRRSTVDGADQQDVVTGLNGPVGIALDVAGGKMYWCEANGHAIKSANLNGSSVATLVSGLYTPQYLALDPIDSVIFWTELVGFGHGKIRRANLNGSGVITLLGDQPADSVEYPAGIAFLPGASTSGVAAASAPLAFRLEQNYPNPFNPTTVISGQWSVTSVVRLAIYDILGREVAVVAHGSYPAGKYSFTFNASTLSSGVYFYRLTAGSATAVRKMSLIK